MLPLAFAVLGLDFLRRLLLPSAPPTSPVSPPYTPPFSGGQCVGRPYQLEVGWTDSRGAVYAVFGNDNSSGITTPYPESLIRSQGMGVSGKIDSITSFVRLGTSTAWRMTINGVFVNFIPSGSPSSPVIRRVFSVGFTDNCGDIPNPNPAPPVASDGLADSAPLAVVDDEELVIGAPLVTIPSIGAIVAAIAAAVRVASDALAAIKELVNAIETIGEILDKIRDWIEDRDKDNDKKKSLYRHDYGSVRKDGFLRLYPNGEHNGFSPQYIDLQLLSIPISYGKYFGELSPNFYRFKSLGHISFVSPSFGVLSTHELEFSRISLNVPDNAFGFFYHLGLDDTIRANVSLFYLKNQ